MISKMVVENFKSYAGVREIGPFHKCFTSIVGPNGSGKSNNIDAMLFVFGKKAKKLRLNKMSELIHSSDAYTGANALQFARVGVHFHEIVDTGSGDEDYSVVPNSQCTVEREVVRGDPEMKVPDKSSYYLNGKVAKFSEVAKYLGDKGIDLDNNRFLILQGEVEMISMMPPKGKTPTDEGLLEYLEDIIGSNQYVEDADAAMKVVEALTETRQEKLNRVKAVEKEKDTLEGGKMEAENFMGKEKEFASYERRDIKMREDIKFSNAQVKQLANKARQGEKKEKELKDKAERAEKSVPTCEKNLGTAEESKLKEEKKLEEIYEEMKGTTAALRSSLESKNTELAPVKEELSVFQAALETAQTESNLLSDATTRSRQQLEDAETELENLDTFQADKEEELKEAKETLEESKTRLNEAEEEEEELASKEVELQKKHSTYVAKAEEAKAALQSGSTRSSAVRGILKAARSGELRNAGIKGRLGDLATISDKYDVAVSTACGMLDHIVCETTQGAQMALKFLRKHGLGRANFIPLDKMKRGSHDRVVETPEGAPRLFDLISPKDSSITPALFLGVGQTIVAPDLETATRWAYDFGKRWRVVTVGGQLIETSGTMAGGGKSVRKGGMNLSSGGGGSTDVADAGAEDAKELEDKANKAMMMYKECRKNRRDLAEEIHTLNKTIKTLTVKIPKLEMELAGVDTTRTELTKSIPELRAASTLSKEDEAKLKTLKAKVAKCEKDMKSTATLASKLEGEVSSLQKQIVDAGGAKLKKQQKAVDTAQKNLKDANSALNAAKVDIVTHTKNAAKAGEEARAAAGQMAEEEKKLADNAERLKELEGEAFKVHEAFEAAKEATEAKKSELDEAALELEELKRSVGKAKMAEVELQGRLSRHDQELKEHNGRVKFWRDEVGKLRDAEEADAEYDLSDDEDEEEEGEEEGDEGKEEGVEGGEGEKEGDEMSVDTEGEEKEKEKETKKKSKMSKIDPLPTFTEMALAQFVRRELKREIEELEKERDQLAKTANMTAIAEYRKKEADYLEKVAELDKITDERNEARMKWDELRRLRLEKFMDGFGQITLKLKEMYQMITLGGDAELELVDSLDPFSEGIVFSVRPPKKSWKNIANLSGGEKTLSSLA
ncbi:hypothetical protein TrRE_jg1036, partial [Triparma retinervis]